MLYLGGLILVGGVCCVPISGSGNLGSPCWRTAPQYALLFCILFHTKSSGKMISTGIKQSLFSQFFLLLLAQDFRLWWWCDVVEYSSHALTMGFEVRLELLSAVITFHFMSLLLLERNGI